jgi:hypothetical protein
MFQQQSRRLVFRRSKRSARQLRNRLPDLSEQSLTQVNAAALIRRRHRPAAARCLLVRKRQRTRGVPSDHGPAKTAVHCSTSELQRSVGIGSGVPGFSFTRARGAAKR